MSLLIMIFAAATLASPGPGEALVGPADLRLMFPAPDEEAVVSVGAFWLDVRPVNNAEFLAFVTAAPKWQRDRVAPVFAGPGYLSHWETPLRLGAPGLDNAPAQPVTRVSWFAARAYCAWRGGRLATEREWELAAAADETRLDARDDPEYQRHLLAWYARPSGVALPDAGAGPANRWGIRDLHGLVWEWIEDFNVVMVTGDSREQGTPDTDRFCGSGALAALDAGDYASFMRFALRGSLSGRSNTRNLGFRCARSTTSAPGDPR